jgi:predicted N-formylglutamate amidohydrolase
LSSRNAVDSAIGSTPLLGEHDPPPAIVEKAGAGGPFLLLGDHAGREVPRALGDLGVPAEAFERHIAWDIGVAGLGARLSDRLGAPFIRQRYSRLVIDCNRAPGRADAVPEVSDGVTIPANRALSPAALAARRAGVAAPYHDRIAQELDARAGVPTVLVSLHSFTPALQGFARPWRFGVLHMGDSPFSAAMLDGLRRVLGAEFVGDNEPYRMDEVDYTIPHHAQARGLDYLEIEVRQDLLADGPGQTQVADLLARLLPQALLEAAAR